MEEVLGGIGQREHCWVVVEAVTAEVPERDPASDQEPPQIKGDLPALPDDEVFF